jgi:large conductance mechanosensitive channel
MSTADQPRRLRIPTGASMSFAREFQAFIARGNVIDLAVAVIIGGAFGKIVTSLVSDVIMPPIGLLIGGINFDQFKLVMRVADPAKKQAEVAIAYGTFLNTVIQFVIVAFVIFLMIKGLTATRRQEAAAEPPPPPGPTSEELLAEIRDILKAQPRA